MGEEQGRGNAMPHARKASKAPAVEKTAKLKMSNTKFRVLIIIPMVVVALVAILVTAAANLLTSTLDTLWRHRKHCRWGGCRNGAGRLLFDGCRHDKDNPAGPGFQ